MTTKNRQARLFRCAGCHTALYDAATEFDSGTGWPSFWQPIDKKNVVEKRDSSLGMVRTEVRCPTDATATWAMSSMMAPVRPACAIA